MITASHPEHGVEDLCATGTKLHEQALREGHVHSEDAAEAPCLVAFGLLHPAVDINPLAAWRVLTLPPPEREAELHRPVAGQSHAWIEYWAGDWTGYDPTNRTPAVESHVVVGRGRDYDDVTPHKGVYRGVAGGPPEVTVEFTRVA